jgi:hypothetical protein
MTLAYISEAGITCYYTLWKLVREQVVIENSEFFRARGARSFSVPIFGSPKGKSAIFFAKSKAMKDAISISSTLFWLS